MQPYQRASQAIREGEDRPFNLVKNIGLSAAGGGAANLGSRAMGRIVPAVGALISKYVPDNILTAGLSKLDPRLGTFMKGAVDAGYTHDDIREFLGEKIEKSQEKPSTDSKNLIEKHSPELHQFITEQMKKGESFRRAGALARLEGGGKTFGKTIEKLMKDHKASWEDMIEAIYGGEKTAPSAAPAAQSQAPAAQMPNQPPGGQNPAMQQAPQMQQPQAQQVGPGQQALVAALSKIPKRPVK